MPGVAYLALAAALLASAAAMLLAALRLWRGRSGTAEAARVPAPATEDSGRPSLAALAALVEARSASPARVGAPPASMKCCPDCAEEVLAAARVCKHCRYRFDEPDELRISV